MSESIRIDVWSDYAWPWCFLASSSLEKLEQSHPVSIHWRSFELRPKGAPPISAEYKARIESGRPRLYAIARQNYGLELNQGPFGIDSRPALIAAKYAEARGVGPAYHAAVMRAYWLEAKAIDQLEVLEDIFVAVGLEGEAVQTAMSEAPLVQIEGSSCKSSDFLVTTWYL